MTKNQMTIPEGYRESRFGIIPDDWRIKTINDIIIDEKPKYGIYIKKEKYGEGFLILKIGEVFSKMIYFGEEIQRVPLKENVFSENEVMEEDILIAAASVKREGIGSNLYIEKLIEKTAFDHNTIKLRVDKDKSFPKFVFFLLNGNMVRRQMLSFATQVGTTFLKSSSIAKINIIVPPLPEQVKIAAILSSVDEAIDKTRVVIAKTERLKKGLMQQLLTRGMPGWHSEWKESKVGEIPGCWEVKKLGDIADVSRGKFTHRPRNDPKFYGGKYPFIQTGDVKNQFGKITQYTQTLSDLGVTVSKEFPVNTIIITIAANIGDTAIATFPVYFPDSLVGIVTYDKIDNVYLEYFLRTRKIYLNSIGTQNAQKNINLETLNPLEIAVPSYNEQVKISKILSSTSNKILSLKTDLAKYRQIKKGLMQQLLTGKIRVRV